jgi:glycosyltransferase involved in cell wall biosynthesis
LDTEAPLAKVPAQEPRPAHHLPAGRRPLLSVVVPSYHNAATLDTLFERIRSTLEPHAAEVDFEVVFVEDGSADETWKVLLALRERHPRHVSLVKLMRNFGQIAALLAGYRAATGDCCASISADLQDPPELIWEMFQAWRQGHRLVAAARSARNDGPMQDFVAKSSWQLLRRFAVRNVPEGGFDYFLMDRSVLEQYVADPEQHIFMQGRLLYFVREPHVIYYERARRTVGRSSTSFMRRVKYFIDGFTAYSFMPLRLMSAVGLLISLFAFVGVVAIIVLTLAYGTKVEGWASIAVLILFLSGIQLVSLGVIGEYLWRAVEEVRKRPHYLVEKRLPREGAPTDGR